MFFFLLVPGSRDDDTSHELAEAPAYFNRILREDLTNIFQIFSYKFVSSSEGGLLSHSMNVASAFTIHSDLELFSQTWIAVPPVVKDTGLAGDWESVKGDFPALRFGSSVMPKGAKLLHGDPPLDLPFKYSDSRTQDFFSSEPWFRKSRISLPDCFELDSTYGGNLINKIALCEGLTKKSLQTAHGIFDLNNDMAVLLREHEEKDFQGVDWNVLVSNMQNLLLTNLKALRRVVLYTSSGVMVNKHMARETVLSRFEGKTQLKNALLYSDFGTPDLFGPLNGVMRENVKMYHTVNSKEWRISVRRSEAPKRKSTSSLSSTPAKKSLSSSSAPLASQAAPASQLQGAKKPYSKGVFHPVRGKPAKRKAKGRGGRGK